ncbi:16S rRNA (guanine(966)-N(2))-methyltransferase RsmD [Candidatus Pelagibacter sp.]|nr:16S rRNA (guanine(966)-N(2))-methyltransferase RsmD [Candidatus Pelagibacter sp.]
MRIISGRNKGKKIIPPVDSNTRPLRDMVKESVFNLINHSNKFNFILENSYVLDLFSGSGSFGLECISRGASQVVFVENYNKALKILNKNLANFGELKFSKIIDKNCFDFINFDIETNQKFNLIFLDPPFKEKKINLLIDTIKEKKILQKNGIIILHRHKKDNLEITPKLNILDQRFYGISKITIGN